MMIWGAILIVCASLFGVENLQYSIVKEIPHDEDAFTQGLIFRDGYLWESTGSSGGGTRIRQIDPETGDVILTTPVFADYFGEGLASDGQRLYQLTWQKEELRLFSYPDLTPIQSIHYEGEGWGLTTNQTNQFIMSNGSDTLYFRDQDFSILRKCPVTLEGTPLRDLNELELIGNKLYANVWHKDFIAVIDTSSGDVTAIIDCSSLRKKAGATASEKVVNGIAVDHQGKIWITGKFWRKMFCISIEKSTR